LPNAAKAAFGINVNHALEADHMATDPKVISTGTLYGSTAMAAAAPQLTAEDYGPDGYIQDIDKPSDDCKAMMAYYNQVEAIIDGINCVRDGKEIYLPKFPKEDADDYKYRNSCGTMTNVYRDIVESLSSKPFAQEVKITKGETPEIAAIVENINGRGDHMHVFLGETFFRGINSAIQWILIDYPTVEIDPNAPPLLQKDEKKLGLRPYWVQVRAKDVLQVKTQNITGVEELSYVRVWENVRPCSSIRQADRNDRFPHLHQRCVKRPNGDCPEAALSRSTLSRWFRFRQDAARVRHGSFIRLCATRRICRLRATKRNRV
jgi:hypothetical protein